MFAAYLLLAATVLIAASPVRGQVDLAREKPQTFDDCDRLVRQYPKELEAYRCYLALAIRKNQDEEAAKRLRRLFAADPDNPRVLYYRALVEGRTGNQEALVELMDRSREAFVKEGDLKGEVWSRVRIAHRLRVRRKYREARAELERAGKAAEVLGDSYAKALVKANRGWLEYNSDDYGRAWIDFKQAETLAFPSGDSGPPQPRASRVEVQSMALSGLGAVCWATGRFQQALEYYRAEAELLHANGNEETLPRYNIALLSFDSPLARDLSADEIHRMLGDSVAAAARVHNRSVEASSRLLLGQFLARQARREGGSLAEAVEQLQRVLSLSRGLRTHEQTCIALWRLGEYTFEQDPAQIGKALELLDESLRLSREADIPRQSISVLQGRSILHAKAGRRDKAVEDWMAALDEIEKLRDHQVDSMVRARVVAGFSGSYRELFNFLLYAPEGRLHGPERGEPTEADFDAAFAVIERMRARVLLDELDAAGATLLLLSGSPAAGRRDALLGQISRTQSRLLAAGLSGDDKAGILRELDRLELEEDKLTDAVARENPVFADLRRPSSPSLDEVRRALGANEALLSFQIRTGSKSWLLAVTRDSLDRHNLPSQQDLGVPLELFLGTLQRRDDVERQGAGRLYGDLLKAAIAKLPPAIDHLIVIPDDILYRLPWAALREAPDTPVSKRYRISIVPSAALWLRWRQREPRIPDSRALALADPTPPVIGAAGQGEGPAERGWILDSAVRLGPLPQARREGRAIAKRLGEWADVLIGKDASESFVKEADLSAYRVVHFAAHGVLDDAQPRRTAVLLAPGDPDEDGLLQIREIVTLDFKGKLVVLSSCHSAAGTLLGGEGVMGLARAFFQAGAHAVVGSLWPLRDDDARELFERFYRYLADGLGVSAALNAAQREMIERGAPAAAWAGVVALGDGNLVPFPGGRPKPFPVLPAAGAVAALVLFSFLLFLIRRRT